MTDDSPTRCAVPDCTEPIRRTGYCYGHYMKSWRYGTPIPVHPNHWIDIAGNRFGNLTVIRRIGSGWLCQCDCGNSTTVRAGDLNRGTTTTCGDKRHRQTTNPTYATVHSRLRHWLGPAKLHTCVDCGRQARQWSYDHSDPDARTSPDGLTYSSSTDHYTPRCASCHRHFDLAVQRANQ